MNMIIRQVGSWAPCRAAANADAQPMQLSWAMGHPRELAGHNLEDSAVAAWEPGLGIGVNLFACGGICYKLRVTGV